MQAALTYGLLLHLKSYTVIYFIVFILFIDGFRNRLKFAMISILTFLALTGVFYKMYGSIEKELGKGTLINLFLVSAIFSNLGQFFVSGANFGGLSGVVYALVGFVWWYGYLAPEKGLSLSKPIIGFLLFWLVLGFLDILPVNVANTAHLLGLISGCLLAVYSVKFVKN